MSHGEIQGFTRDAVRLARLGALARQLGAMPELDERAPAETRFGPLMRALPEGLEAAPALVAWAVDVADRADWTPPAPRGPGLVLARLWVSRARWQRPLLVLLALLAVAIVSLFTVHGIEAARERGAQQAYLRDLDALRTESAAIRARIAPLEGIDARIAQRAAEAQTQAENALRQANGALSDGQNLDEARRALQEARAAARQVRAWRESAQALARADAAAWPARHAVLRGVFEQRLAEALTQGSAESLSAAAAASADFAAWLPQLDAQPLPATADAEASAALAAARERTEAAVRSADLQAAQVALADEQRLADFILSRFELRIVDRAGVQSGVWRYTEGSPEARDYYLVVEAVDATGRVLVLPIENEETQRTESVRMFGVRVPAEVYERYRAEKIARGRIEQRQIGRKPSGVLKMQFDLPSSGGYITEW